MRHTHTHTRLHQKQLILLSIPEEKRLPSYFLQHFSPGSMSSKLDLASGWRNSDLGVKTISWCWWNKGREGVMSDWQISSRAGSHALLTHSQAFWRAAGSVCGERGSSWQEWSSWPRSSYSQTADWLQSPQSQSGGDRRRWWAPETSSSSSSAFCKSVLLEKHSSNCWGFLLFLFVQLISAFLLMTGIPRGQLTLQHLQELSLTCWIHYNETKPSVKPHAECFLCLSWMVLLGYLICRKNSEAIFGI